MRSGASRRATILPLLLLLQAAPASAAWRGDNQARLEAFARSAKGKVAIFDWDNTSIKNDVGDATLFWMVAHDKLLKPKSWRATSSHLTDDAAAALDAACGKLPSPLPTSTDARCADAILSIYGDETLADGKTAAWKQDYDPDLIQPSYAWATQLTAGYTPAEISRFARTAIARNLANPPGAKQKLGTRQEDAWMRVYPEIKDLVGWLERGGADVWVASASSEYIVREFAKKVGVKADHVIGVRSVLDGRKRITSELEGCGTIAGPNQALISYRKGKRCWINKVIFKETDPTLMMEKPSPTAFAAGDSDTDVFFVSDARELRLVINRNKNQLMCLAYENKDGKWLINPMFIEPLPEKKDAYSCSKYGIADQRDAVH